MKSTKIRFWLFAMLYACPHSIPALTQSDVEVTNPEMFVIRFTVLSDLNTQKFPEGTVVHSSHAPYNILVVSNSEMDRDAFYQSITNLPSVVKIERAWFDSAGHPVFPTGTIIYEPAQGMESKCREFCNDLGCVPSRELPALGWSAAILPTELSFGEFSEYALGTGLFSKIMRDEIVLAFEHSNDPLYSTSWHVYQLNDKDIDANDAWPLIPTQNAPHCVAIIDGHGYDTAHPDLAGQWTDTYNAVDQTTNVLPVSIYEKHGTACAGIPGSLYNNGLGSPGLGGGFLDIQAIKIGYNPSSSGAFSTSSLIQADAINRAISNANTAAISMSFGGSTYQTTFYNAINSARLQGRNGKGIIVFGSTGNSGSSSWTNYPASYSGVVAVGSTSSSDYRSSFSNYGAGLMISAPGSGIPTTDVSGSNGYNTTDYTNFSGTSAACPVAASVGAMVITANPNLTETQVKEIIAQTCEKVGGYIYNNDATQTLSTWSSELGYGRVNMRAAVELAMTSSVVVADVYITSPTVNITAPVVGQTITISANQGITPANGNAVFPLLEYRWSIDQTWSSDDIIIGTDPSSLGNGLSLEYESITYAVPSGTGTRYILIKCDSGSAVAESNENNNVTVVTVTVSAPVVLPDVTLSGFTADDTTPNVGQTVSIMCNQLITSPNTTSTNVIVEYRYSTDAIWSTSDVLIGTDTSALGTSITSSAEQINFTIPSGTGTRYILAKVDNTGLISESNETNNTYSVFMTVSAAVLPPDVSISQLSATTTSVNQAQSVTVICQQVITNAPATPVSVVVQYRWSTDQTWSASDIVLGTSTSTLSSSTSSEVESITFNVPSGAGTYYLLLTADANNTITESNEFNMYSLQFTVAPSSSTPDIFVDAVSVSSTTVTVGSMITVDCYQNISIANANALNVFQEYRWATSATYSSSFPIVGVDYSSLGAGDPDDPEDHTFTIPAGTGQRYVMIICDTGNNVSESNEANNVVVIPVTVISASIGEVPDSNPLSFDKDEDSESPVTDESIALIEKPDALNEALRIYPNPARNFVQIINLGNSHDALTYEIRDVRGSLMKTGLFYQSGGTGNLDVSGLPSGYYLLSVIQENSLRSVRFCVQ